MGDAPNYCQSEFFTARRTEKISRIFFSKRFTDWIGQGYTTGERIRMGSNS